MMYMDGVAITGPPWYSNGPIELVLPTVGAFMLFALPTLLSALSLRSLCPCAYGGAEGGSSFEKSEDGKISGVGDGPYARR